MCWCNWDFYHWKRLKPFRKKARAKEFFYSPERPRTGISKPNCVKVVSLLSRNLKLNYPRNKLIPYKSPILWKTQPKLFQICGNRTKSKNRFETKLRLENSFFEKISCKSEQCLKISVIVIAAGKKLWIAEILCLRRTLITMYFQVMEKCFQHRGKPLAETIFKFMEKLVFLSFSGPRKTSLRPKS